MLFRGIPSYFHIKYFGSQSLRFIIANSRRTAGSRNVSVALASWTAKAALSMVRVATSARLAEAVVRVDLSLWTINIHHSAKEFQHPLARWLLGKTYANMNHAIYIIDFYQESSFVSKVIQLNNW